jgi:hypothetical protein
MEKTANDIAEEIFKTAMVTFGNMLSRDSGRDPPIKKIRLHRGMLKVVTQLSTLNGFRQKFLKPNNLRWLNMLQWDLLEGDKLGFASNTPIGALNSWLQITGDFDDTIALKDQQIKNIISSGILQSSRDKGALDVIKFIRFVDGLSSNESIRESLLRPQREKPVDILIQLLEYILDVQDKNMLQSIGYWDKTRQDLFGTPRFQEWKDDLNLLVAHLRQYDHEGAT